jgi:hypothetical protein
MMVALLLYSYALGERSSRRIERRCVEDVATRVICANRRPDHTTIARFRQRHERALAGLFGEVLALCGRPGSRGQAPPGGRAPGRVPRQRGLRGLPPHGRQRNGRRLGAHSPPKPYTPPERPQGKINLTDPDSRNVKTPRGWVQGYNAQAVTTEDQIVIAAEVHVSSGDFG